MYISPQCDAQEGSLKYIRASQNDKDDKGDEWRNFS